MGAPNDPESTDDEAAPSQKEPLLPPPATGVPVVTPPPSLDYVPWSTDLFDCFSDPNLCCITFFCPCVTFGEISEIVDRGNSCCVLNGAIYFLIAWLTGYASCFSFFNRLKMRRQYRIRGDVVEDFILHCFCEPCALTQEYRELQNRGFYPSLGWAESVERQNREAAMAPMRPVAPVVEDGMKR